MKSRNILIILLMTICIGSYTNGQLKPDTLTYKPFIWKSEAPADCPFERSAELSGIKLLGIKSGFHFGDTWYPTWADDGRMYSPWTDGSCWRLDGSWENSGSGDLEHATTGQAVIEGDDPMTLKVYSLGTSQASSLPYHGRYPCGSLVYNGVWYYGTYCLDPAGASKYGNMTYNWPWMGPFVGFRYSTDYGRKWTDCPKTPEKPLFKETGIDGFPVKIGSPHFVDFGKNMQYSPDGKAYLIAHGADSSDTKWRYWNDSWITGDQIYLLRVTPSIENMNDISKYEFFAGDDKNGTPVWTRDFEKIKPMLEWNNNMGCVTMTYNAPLKKYLMCVTDGGNTCAKMSTYILESGSITGPWKLVTYLKDFGEQAYFVNIPSKFISRDGKTAWLLYSGNFAPDWNGMKIKPNPPGSHYGLVLQKIEFLAPSQAEKTTTKLRRADCFFGMHFDLHASEDITDAGRTLTPAMIDTFLLKVRPDFIQIDCKGHPGISSYPTKVGYHVKGFEKDPLKLFREITEKDKVALFMHYSGVMDAKAVKEHPSWAIIKSNGERNMEKASFFSPYLDSLMIPQLKELSD